MGVRAGGILVAALFALCAFTTSAALADGPVGGDPSSNFAVGPLPSACWSDPTGTQCIDASVGYLDQARASLGQPAYVLPGDFASLSPIQQDLILTNEDRAVYRLPPITGLTDALDQDAAAGVQGDSDPQPSDSSWRAYTSNWAGGYPNIVLAYEGWMYDDGPGSDNLDCTSSDTSGCWGHRDDILWQFDGSGPLAMGAAAGTDSSGSPGYAMLIEQKAAGADPNYTYTWAQAVADGAGGSSAGSQSVSNTEKGVSRPAGARSRSPAARIADAGAVRIRIRGHRLTVTILLPQGRFERCAVTGRSVHGKHIRRTKRCRATVTFSHLPAGKFWLRISSAMGTIARRVAVR